MRVTFDTNTLDPITRPAFNGGLQAACITIHQSLVSRRLAGYFCETVLTVEGGARQPPREDTLARARRALDLGMRILRSPRAGGIRIDLLGDELYAKAADEAARLERNDLIAAAIERRGLGFARVTKMARKLSGGVAGFAHGPASLDRAITPTEKRRAARAIAEWADGDSVAAHHGYANDLFCTQDRATKAGRYSVMHPAQRGWLRRVYGVEFVTIAELAALLQ